MSYIQYFHLELFLEGFEPLFKIETDRGGAVVAACFLEDFVRDVLEHYYDAPLKLPPLAKPFTDKRSFAFQIDQLRRKELVDRARIADLHFLRDLRNIFAHDLHATNFEFEAVTELMRAHLGDIEGQARKDAFIKVLQTCARALADLSVRRFDANRKVYNDHVNSRLTAHRVLTAIANGEDECEFVDMQDGKGLYNTSGAAFLMNLNDRQPAGVHAFQIGDDEWRIIDPESAITGGADAVLASWPSNNFPPAVP